MREASDFGRIRQLVPTAQIVFIYRNLFDVARSAKAGKLASGLRLLPGGGSAVGD